MANSPRNSHVDIATRRRLAADLVAQAITPIDGSWSETRMALVQPATGAIVAILPVSGWSYAGAREVAAMLQLEIKSIPVTVSVAGDEL